MNVDMNYFVSSVTICFICDWVIKTTGYGRYM